MTQVAATVASIGGKASHAGIAGKAHGAKSGAAGDFASLAAGLGLPGDDGDGSDADPLAALTGDDAGKSEEKGSGKSKGKAADPGILDLASGTAAQNIVPDTVVAAAKTPVPTSAPVAKTDTVSILDGKGAVRSGWTKAKDAATTGNTNMTLPAAVDTAAKNASPVPSVAVPATSEDAALPEATEALVQQVVSPQTGEATKPVTTRAERHAARAAARQAAAVPADPGKAATADTAKTDIAKTDATKTDTAALPPIFSALPQAVRDPKALPAATDTAQPVQAKAADPTQIAAAQVTVAQSPASPVIDTARPVASASHRTGTGKTETGSAETVSTQPAPAAATGHKDKETAQDHRGKDSEAGTNAAMLGNDARTDSAKDARSSSSNHFSDILQSLPPIAQSRMGVAVDASSAVAGAGNVGATLQNNVIDMGVGGQWIDRMAKEITALASGTGNSRFQLNPPNLGRIQVDIQHGASGSQVQLLTETDEAARRLRDGKPGLEADARMSALSINSITIERSSAGFDGGRDPNPQQNSQQNPQQGFQRHQQASDQGFGTNTQSGGQGSQAGSQASAQGNGQGQQNSNGQGKGPWSRDVLNERAGTVAQDGSSVRRDGDRLVRYA